MRIEVKQLPEKLQEIEKNGAEFINLTITDDTNDSINDG